MRQSLQRFLLPGFFMLLAGLLLCMAPNGYSFRQPEIKESYPKAALGTKQPASAAMGFVAMGDWGAGTTFQKQVAQQMIEAYRRTPYDTVLTLGDNIYEIGNVKKLGKSYFTDTYAPLIQHGVKFIVALGNHDEVGGFRDDQVRFFDMPGYYYQERQGPFEFFVINSNHFGTDRVQQAWLDRALRESKADWKIVLGHHPIYSSGEHGNNLGLQQTLEPLLIKHQVPFYLAGHDHDYERFAPIHGVQYIVSGGGGAYLRGFSRIAPHSLIRLKAHHFLNFRLDQDTLKLQVIDKTGQVIDTAQWPKPIEQPKPQRASTAI